MEAKPNLNAMKRRYARLAARLGKVGLVLHGTITERTITRDDPQRPGTPKSYGPYYQWTFKRDGKTVTVNLTRRQARRYQRAIENQRDLEQTLEEMRRLSRRILEETTTGVKKRKPKS